MASKLFLGDMPEVMANILNNLDKEYNSLFSCALVSRHWCKMSIPILWRDPFSFNKKPMFISRYFSYLDDDIKLNLKEYGIITNFQNTLFHYARFLEVLDLYLLDCKVKRWISILLSDSKKNSNKLKYLIVNLLFKKFIENGASLYKLDLYISDCLIELKLEILELLKVEQNKRFLSRLRDLSVDIISGYCTEKAIKFLNILAENAKNINTLEFDVYESGYKPQLCEAFTCIIKSQEQLRIFNIGGDEELSTEFYGIISALEYQKKALKEIIIDYCAYSTEFKTLINCENLKVIRILDCEDENLLKTLNNGLYNVTTLEINSYLSINASNIIQILKKSGTSMRRLKLYTMGHEISSQTLLVETLKTFCPNINYLNISGIKFSSQFLELIGHLRQLQFLTLCWVNYGSEEMIQPLVQFAKILPSTLQYLDLSDQLNSHIDILLNNCDAPLRKLLFRVDIDNDYNYNNVIKAVIRFCMRKKSLSGVNIVRSKNDNYGKRFRNSTIFDTDWNKIKNDLEGFVELVPYENIIVNC